MSIFTSAPMPIPHICDTHIFLGMFLDSLILFGFSSDRHVWSGSDRKLGQFSYSVMIGRGLA